MTPEQKPYLNLTPSIVTKKPDLASLQKNESLAIRRLEMVNNLNRYIALYTKSETKILRERQMDVFVDIKKFLEKGGTQGYVEAPTGFGKTVLFSHVVEAIGKKTVIVVPTKLLVEQTYEQFKKNCPDLDVGRIYDDKKEKDRMVTITTYNSLDNSNGGVNPLDIDLLILDEAHRSLTKRRTDAVGRFENAIKLGFTATSEYTQEKRVKNLLKNEIHKITLNEAVKTGLLSSFTVFLAKTKVDLSKVTIAKNGDYDPKELEAAVNIGSRNKSAVKLYKQLTKTRPELSKAVVNCVSIKHADKVKNIFKKSGISAEVISSRQNRKEREDILNRYRSGEIKVLMNINILNEGFDEPQAALMINLRPTASELLAKQRGGRILRLDPENPNKHAIIIEYLDEDRKYGRNPQITFAQAAGAAQITNPIQQDINRGDKPIFQQLNTKGLETVLQKIGLKVITNPEQVIKIVKDLDNKNENIPGFDNLIQKIKEKANIADADINDIEGMDFQDTYFIVTATNLQQVFKNEEEKLLHAAENIISRVVENMPNLISLKKSNGSLVILIKKRSFFRFMEGNGHKIKKTSEVIIFP